MSTPDTCSGTSDFLAEAAVPDLASYEQLRWARSCDPLGRRGTEHVRDPDVLSVGPLPLDQWRRVNPRPGLRDAGGGQRRPDQSGRG